MSEQAPTSSVGPLEVNHEVQIATVRAGRIANLGRTTVVLQTQVHLFDIAACTANGVNKGLWISNTSRSTFLPERDLQKE
jgi:hypothetical protein